MQTATATPPEHPSVHPSGQPRAHAAGPETLVWDAPVRLVHWLLVACFAGAWITAERDAWALVHVTLGWTFVALVLFRLLWGLVGPRTARFTSFVRGPAAVLAYLRSLLSGQPERHEGHNPAGALAILAMLGLAMLIGLTAWGMDQPGLARWAEELHEGAAELMLAVVLVHVAGVLVASLLHRENLVRAMLTGRKRGAHAGIRRAAWPVAAALLVAVLAFWALQWQAAPAGGLVGVPAAMGERGHDAGRDGGDDDDD